MSTNTNKFTCVSEISKYVTILTSENSTQTPRGSFIDNIGHDGGEMVLILIDKFLQNNIGVTRGTPNTLKLREDLQAVQMGKSTLASGKEILLIKSFEEKADFLILENFRFDDDGNKKIRFQSNKVVLKTPDGNDTLDLIQRFASWTGLTKFMDENPAQFEKANIVVIGAAEEIEIVENTPFAVAYSEFLQELLAFNKDLMTCLHCGEKISTNDSFFVEIDELQMKANIGNVHKECLRSADRIMGKSGYKDLPETNLINFNYQKWIELLERGQGLYLTIELLTRISVEKVTT